MNLTLHNEQSRRQGNVRRPRAGNPVLLMLMFSDGNYNHANSFRNGRGRDQSVSSAMQLVQLTRAGPSSRLLLTRAGSMFFIYAEYEGFSIHMGHGASNFYNSGQFTKYLR